MALVRLAVVVGAAVAAFADDVEVVPSDGGSASTPASFDLRVLPNAGGGTVGANGHLAVVEHAQPHFRMLGPLGGEPCGKRVRTSVTARANKCRYATNGGPFNMKDGSCSDGVGFHEGKVLGTGGFARPLFGSLANGSWVLGTVSNASAAARLGVVEAIPGFYWLVRGGRNVAPNGTYWAPRTTIGVDRRGRLLVLEVDGCEPQKGCAFHLGKTDRDMAALLLEQGAWHAINLDGGGSSTVVANGTVINHPTDTDYWLIKKERAVTTITCVL